jgi:gluconate 2-dehydrogenase alpha chain
MVTKLKDVDVVTIGVGMTGAMLAKEFTLAGLTVVGLERGPDRRPHEEAVLPRIRDELKYVQRMELMQDNSIDTITFRNEGAETALPIRRIGAFLPGEGVGGSGIHWGGMHWRLPSDFKPHHANRTLRRQCDSRRHDDPDWPSYGRARALATVRQDVRRGGKAGNLKARRSKAATPSKPRTTNIRPRRSNFRRRVMMIEAAKTLGYHPFPAPFGAASTPYKNIYGVQLGACEYCGFCGRNSCEANAKASAPTHIMPALRDEPKFELRTRAFVTKLLYDKAGKKVTGVLYTDMKTGEEYEQPANIVILSSFVFSNAHDAYSGIGSPTIRRPDATGRQNYCYQFEARRSRSSRTRTSTRSGAPRSRGD